jgi:hypothetical protein
MKLSVWTSVKSISLCILALEAALLSSPISLQVDSVLEKEKRCEGECIFKECTEITDQMYSQDVIGPFGFPTDISDSGGILKSTATTTKGHISRSCFHITNETSQTLNIENKAVSFETIAEVSDPQSNIVYDPYSQIFLFGQSGYYSITFVAVIGENSTGTINFSLNGQSLSSPTCSISSTSGNSIINTIISVPSGNSNVPFQIVCTNEICNFTAVSLQIVFLSN